MEEQRQSKLLWSIKEEKENNNGKLAHNKTQLPKFGVWQLGDAMVGSGLSGPCWSKSHGLSPKLVLLSAAPFHRHTAGTVSSQALLCSFYA